MKKIILLLFLFLFAINGNAQCWKMISAGNDNTLAIKQDGTLWGWGDSVYTNGTTPVQIGTATNWETVSAGYIHALAIKTDGTLWAWGISVDGVFGSGIINDFSILPKQIGTQTDWLKIAAGTKVSSAIKTNGTLWSWGYNAVGQVGDGTTATKLIPTQIGTDTNWSSIALHTSNYTYSSTLALKTDGTMWAWGTNNNGQLGDGTYVQKNAPTQVGTDTNWSSIDTGESHSLAIKTNGTLWAWGSNQYGELGVGTTVLKNIPTQIGTSTLWTSVRGGTGFSVGTQTGSSLLVWGVNSSGQLGNNTLVSQTTPFLLTTSAQSVSVGSNHTFIQNITGTYSWGYNADGVLGDGTTINKNIPTLISCPTSRPQAMAQTFCSSTTVANLVASGTALQWYATATLGTALLGTTTLATGTYYVTQTENGVESLRTAVAVTVSTTPAPTAPTSVAQTFCSGATIANLTASGTTLQWYTSLIGNTALPTTTALATGTYYVSESLNGCESTRTAVSVTINNTLAPTAATQSFCNGAAVANLVATGTNLKWYTNFMGGTDLVATLTLASGTYYVSQALNSCESSRTAVTVIVSTTPAPTVAAQTFCNSGTVASLTVTETLGATIQWYSTSRSTSPLVATTALSTGTYYVSQTINGCESARTAVSVIVNSTPAPTGLSPQVYSGTATIADLVLNGISIKWYTAATSGSLLPVTTLLVDGTVYYASQTLVCGESPIRLAITVTSASVPTGCWSTIAAGAQHTIAIKTAGSLWGWGRNNNSQLGDGTNVQKTIPTQIGTETNWLKIALGESHTLAIKNNGTLWAWGANNYGQLGDETITGKNVPTQIGIDTNWSQIAANGNFSLAIKTDGTLWSWGQGNSGQLGSGTLLNKDVPTQVGNLNTWSKIAAGYLHTISLKTDGSLWVCGANFYGQLGDGTNIDKTNFVQIGTATNWNQIAGGYHSVALKIDGSLWTWGRNTNGQLGDNTTIDSYNPIQIGTSTNWSKISAGNQFTTALKNDNSLWSWGFNGNGELGDGTFISKNSPTQIGTETNWTQIASGSSQKTLLKSDDTIWACGNNTFGQLGDGTTISKNSPSVISCSTILSTALYEIENNLKIYPNPTMGYVTIELNNLNNANLQVSDSNGRILFAHKLNNTNNIDISNLPTATYIFKIDSEQGTATSKVIKK